MTDIIAKITPLPQPRPAEANYIPEEGFWSEAGNRIWDTVTDIPDIYSYKELKGIELMKYQYNLVLETINNTWNSTSNYLYSSLDWDNLVSLGLSFLVILGVIGMLIALGRK